MSNTADQYVELCEQSTKIPNVFEFLGKFSSLSPQDQLEVVLVDQHCRWQHNQAIPIEHYRARLPDLTDDIAVPLLVEEYGYLEKRGAAPPPTEYVQLHTALNQNAHALLCEELDVDISSKSSDPGAARTLNPIATTKCIGRYEVICSVGRGAFGEVFLAKDPWLDRNVAVKVSTLQRVEMGGGIERLLNEARLIAKLNHPNIVPVYDFGESDDGSCYIVSKYIKGKNLRAENRKSITHVEAAGIAATLASALHAAHAAGIVHRDVKPANVLLDARREPHLLDFGLSLTQKALAKEKSVAGTPAYMSPEQASCDSESEDSKGSVDGRSDIYSLGVMFYEMLAGKRPALHAVDVQPPRQLVDSIPKELERICLKALSHATSDRYNTAKDFAEELHRWLGEISGLTDHDAVLSRADTNERWKSICALPTGPSIAVMPFAVIDENPEDIAFAHGLCEETTTQLTRFKDLLVLGRSAMAHFAAEQQSVHEIAKALDVDFVLTASVRRSSDQIRVNAEIVEASNLGSVWSKSFRGDLSVQDVFDIEDQIAEQVAASVGLPAGVIARSRIARQRTSASIDAYDCITRYYQYRHSLEITLRSAEVQREIEELVTREPDYATAWAALAITYIDAAVYQFPSEYSPEQLLIRGGEAASLAVEKDPGNSTALTALFRYEYHFGQFPEFERTVERALEANPNDTEMLILAACCYGLLGQMDRALPLAHKAITLHPNPPHYYFIVDCWQGMFSNDFESALSFSNRLADLDFWKPIYQIVCLGHLGRIEEAEERLSELKVQHPDFINRFIAEQKIWHTSEPAMQVFLQGFAKAGVDLSPKAG